MWFPILLQAAPGGGAQGLIQLVVPFGLMFLVFWFLIIKPQKKEQEEHKNFLGGLKSGDQVVTAGGIFGKVVQVDDTIVTLEIAKNTKIKILKAQIQGDKNKHAETDAKSENDAEDNSDKKEDKKKGW